MKLSANRCFVLALTLSLGMVAPALGASVIGTHSANGVFVQSQVTVGFNDPVFGSSVPADFASNSNSAIAANFNPLGTATASQAILPAVGAVKDQAQGTLTSEFELGVPFGTVPIDEGRFTVNAIGSATTSLNLASNPSDAIVSALGQMHFFVDQFGVVANFVVGQLNLPALRALLPYETQLQLDVFDNTVPILTLIGGGSGATIPLATAHSYDLYLKYDMRVPFGNDPPFHLDYNFTIVPEPNSLVLAGVGFVALVACGWRRHRN